MFKYINKILILVLLFSPIGNIFSVSGDSGESWVSRNEAFFLQILSKELNNSDFFSLQQRARSLGLPEMQTADAYRRAIAAFYGITLMPAERFTGDKIILERAGELKMIKLKEVDEENLHIIGGVRIIINARDENNRSIRREIEADEVFIDLKNKEITGSGNVIYIDDKLEFNGEHFYYNYDINRGTLLRGRTKIKQKDNAGLEGAFFIGDRITYLGNEESILYDGKLTTCDKEDPHYYIDVKRLWLNQDSEWGLLSGTVYVGTMPFLYFPVYYHPKNIAIHPSLGYRTREGWFVQTTYGILGGVPGGGSSADKSSNDYGVQARRKNPDSSSIFMITKRDIDEKLNKYYDSRDFYKKNPDLRFLPKDLNSFSFSLRIFGDAYSNLGFYYGAFYYFKADHSKFPFEMTLLTDYAFSRRLWKDTETDQYLPFNPSDKTKEWGADMAKNMLNSYFFPENNPFLFRTAQYLKFEGHLFRNKVNLSYSGQIEYASDGFFYKDFYNRKLTFSYIDLLADSLRYNIEQQKDAGGVFTTKEETKVTGVSSLNDFIHLKFSPPSVPDLFGLRLINSINLEAKFNTLFENEKVLAFSPEKNDKAEDHRYERYFLKKVTVPESNASMRGELLNYSVFSQMPDKVRKAMAERKKNIEQPLVVSENEKQVQSIYGLINEIHSTDASTDKRKLDYKHLLPFSALPVKDDKGNNIKIENYKSNVISDFFSESKKDTKKDEEKVNNNTKLISVTESSNQSLSNINLISFNLGYDLSNSTQRNFLFNTKVERKDDSIDNMEELLKGDFDFDKRLMRSTIDNTFSANLSGGLRLFKLFSNSNELFVFSPSLKFSHNLSRDDIEILERYLANRELKESDKELERNNTIFDNRRQTYYNLKYSDTMTNNLSFGQYFLEGTNISTNFNIDLYDYNEQTAYNFGILNDINKKLNTEKYEAVDTGNYFKRVDLYNMITSFNSSFALAFNLFPKDSAHSLRLTTGSKINYIIPSAQMTILKNELWEEQKNSIKYQWSDVSSIFKEGKKYDVDKLSGSSQPKDYIYYRVNGANLGTKIDDFYKKENFWEGLKNFRHIFENITLRGDYKYVSNQITYFSLVDTVTFKLINMGEFSDGRGKGGKTDFSVFPDNNLDIKVFNSMFSYVNNLTFTKKYDEKLKLESTDPARKLDENNIISFTNTHTFTFTLNGNLFSYKLPSGNWFGFTSTTDLRHDMNKVWYGKSSAGNADKYLYLNEQKFTFNGIMNIFSLNLNFKNYDFVRGGPQIILDSGTFNLGYNFNNIPRLFGLIDFTINPVMSYNFTPKRSQEHNTTGGINPTSSLYYSNNRLSVSLDLQMIIGKGRDYETKFTFKTASDNKKLYKYYDTENPALSFLEDLVKSFNFAREQDRIDSAFNLQSVFFSVEHNLHDWLLYFEYSGKPERDYSGSKYVWDNTFTFQISWNIDSDNQLMKLFNKSKVDEKYEKGIWRQPSMSLDFNE